MANSYKATPWPKRLTRIPKHVSEGLANIDQNDIITAGIKRIFDSEIIAGLYLHLGISLTTGILSIRPVVTPPDDMGKFSNANIYGYSQKRHDLPKVSKTFTLTGKNYQGGDVENSYSRDVYQIEKYPPLNMQIQIRVVHEEKATGGTSYFIRFDVDRHLDKSDVDFARKLRENLGFLRENSGILGIYPTGIDDITMTMITFTSWEFLPPGVSVEELVDRVIGRSSLTTEQRAELEIRLKVLHELQPGGGFVAGTQGLAGYVAARFGDDLTILENRSLGNAIYAIYRDWPTFSKMSRTEIMNSGRDSDFDRIEHRGDWIKRLQEIVQSRRSDI